MAETITLQAAKRTVKGKHVRHLRKQGLVPAVLYGPTFENIDLQIEWTELRPVLLKAGGTQVIQIAVDGEVYNALARRVQRRPVRGDVMHVDFYRVRMDVAIRTEVPVVLTGTTKELEAAGGVVIHERNAVEVECLPGNLPSEIPVDVSGLKQVGDMILASALPPFPGVTYHIDPNEVIVTTTYLQAREEEEVEAAAAAEPELVRRREEEAEAEE